MMELLHMHVTDRNILLPSNRGNIFDQERCMLLMLEAGGM